MNLSVSYNFFNGEKHLQASVRSIRASVDFVSVVYQEISNSGEPITDIALALLTSLKKQGLVDVIYKYEPNLQIERFNNELEKRRIGLQLALDADCTHFFTMDADEFYRRDELDFAKKLIVANNIESSSVSSFFHLKSPIWRAKDSTCCAFITRISAQTVLGEKKIPYSEC